LKNLFPIIKLKVFDKFLKIYARDNFDANSIIIKNIMINF